MEKDSVQYHKALLKELNSVRTDPQGYSNILRKYAKMFEDKILVLPNKKRFQFKEGASAFEDAADFLDKTDAVKDLVENEYLTESARLFVEKCADLTSEKIAELPLDPCLDEFGEIDGECSQFIDFGSDSTELCLVNLLADDGDETRANRKNLFNTRLHQVGIARSTHSEYGHITLILFAQKFLAKKGKSLPVRDDTNEETNEIVSKIKENLKKKKSENQKPQAEENQENDNDFDVPEGYTKILKEERLVTEKGVQKKITKITKFKEDGTKETEITKEQI